MCTSSASHTGVRGADNLNSLADAATATESPQAIVRKRWREWGMPGQLMSRVTASASHDRYCSWLKPEPFTSWS